MATEPRALHAVEDDNSAGARLRRRRRGLGLSQTAVGDRLGVRQQTVGLWESGERPRSRYLPLIAAFLDIEVEELVGLYDGEAGTADPSALSVTQEAVLNGAARRKLANDVGDIARTRTLTAHETELFQGLLNALSETDGQ